jgi:hypothetical protein
VRDRGNSSVPGERKREKKKYDGEIQMCREERETIEHMWSGCGEMREREGKERGEIMSEDGRDIGMEEGGKDREGEGWGIERKNVSLI